MEIRGASGNQYQMNSAVSAQPGQRERETQSMIERIRESREKIESHRKSMEKFRKENKKVNYGDAVMAAYSRLRGARNHAQVNAASAYARRRIVQLKAALHSDSDNAPAIKGAIRQLEKAVRRGERKKRELDEEAALERRKARQKEEKERAKRARLELSRRRAQRSIRENGYLREAEIEQRQGAMLTATRRELREQAESLGSAAQALNGAAQDSAIAQYAAQVSASEAAAAEVPGDAVDVQV